MKILPGLKSDIETDPVILEQGVQRPESHRGPAWCRGDRLGDFDVFLHLRVPARGGGGGRLG